MGHIADLYLSRYREVAELLALGPVTLVDPDKPLMILRNRASKGNHQAITLDADGKPNFDAIRLRDRPVAEPVKAPSRSQ